MHIFIVPVSGGSFPCQISALHKLIEYNITSDIICCSSGGNVATYIMQCAHWDYTKLKAVINQVQQSIFLRNWNSLSITNVAMGYFKGAMYKEGYGCQELLTTFLDSDSIITKEIWTGVYDIESQQEQLFCNINKNDSILAKQDNIDLTLYQTKPPIYMDGDIATISQVINASASIPGIVAPQKINDKYYVDGGMGAASPIIFLQDNIITLAVKQHILHLVYINGCDLNNPDHLSTQQDNFMQYMQQSVNIVARTMLLNDRLICYQIISRMKNAKLVITSGPLDHTFVTTYTTITNNYSYTLLEIYPYNYHAVDITNFTPMNIIDSYQKQIPQLCYRLYY